MNSELRKLQFIGAGPKMAIPETEKLVKGGLEQTSDEHVAENSKPQCEQFTLLVSTSLENQSLCFKI